jgi:CP family cyanate transporter-like MFS transporter
VAIEGGHRPLECVGAHRSTTCVPVRHSSLRAPIRVVAGLFLASLALRPQILAIGPLLPLIRGDLALSAGVAGLLTTIPVLCMGVFAPIGPRVAANLGTRSAFAGCLALIIGFGLIRSVVPSVELLLVTTLGIGIGIGIAGAIPSMVVSQGIAHRPALGTGAYAGGIVAGSTLAAAFAVPLAVDGDWRRALAIISIASFLSLAAWLLVVRGERSLRVRDQPARRLPWRNPTAWLLVLVFGLQSILFYGVVAWLPNIFVEQGWTADTAGALVAVFNGVGLLTTIGLPLVADRLGARRPQLTVASIVAVGAMAMLIIAPALAFVWVAILGLALGAVFPLVLTLPLDVASDPAEVGSFAALMLLGGYILSAAGPVALGAARDLTGDFGASLVLLVALAIVLSIACTTLSPTRLRRTVRPT